MSKSQASADKIKTRNKNALTIIISMIHRICQASSIQISIDANPGYLRRDFKKNSTKVYNQSQVFLDKNKDFYLLGEHCLSTLMQIEDSRFLKEPEKSTVAIKFFSEKFPDISIDEMLNIQYDEKMDMFSVRHKCKDTEEFRYIAIKI